MRIKRLITLGSAFMLSTSSFLIIAFPGVAHAAAPYTCTWTGRGDGTSFSDANNWSGCNSAAPQPSDNDNLIFDNTSLSSEPTLNNDITDLTLGNVEFTGSNTTYSDQISGNAITITSGVNDSTQSSFPTGFSNTVVVSGNQTITTTDNNGTLLETLQGSGNLIVTGGGWVQLAGGTENLTNYTGNISSTNSVIELATYASITSSGSITVSGNAALDLNFEGGGKSASTITYDLPISIGGSGVSKIGALNLDGGQDSDVANTLSGSVTLTSDVQVTADGDNTLNINGPITYNGYSISSAGANVTTITVPSGDNQSSTNPTVGSNVTEVVDGTVGSVTVDSSGLLKGLGTVGNTSVESGGGIAPGHSPGCLAVDGNLAETGTYTANLDGTTACTGYDQLVVTGTVNLTGSTLDPVVISGFTPAVGNSFEIINNEGSSPVTGTFSYNGANLAEGSTFTVNGTEFSITYKGGSGNSVVISVVSVTTAKTPDTGLGLTSTYIGLPLLGTIIMAGGLYLISRKFKHPTTAKRQ